MKPNQLITTMLAATALFVASCSTPKLAQNTAMQDDVYNTTASAKEYIPQTPVQYATTETTEDSIYRSSDPYYDMDYSSRIDRFYYGNPYRGYYDPFYNYYGYNNWAFNYGGFNNWGFSGWRFNNWGYNNWGYNNFGFNNWGIHGGLGYDPYWGYYSNFNQFGTGYYGGGLGWGGFYGGGIYYGGNVGVRNNENYRPRPTRGGENGAIRADGSIYFPGSTRANNGTTNTSNVPRTRAEMYNPTNNGNNTVTRSNGTSNAPTRSNSGSNARPTRGNETQSRPTYTPPTEQSRPPVQQSAPPPSRGESSAPPSRGESGGRPTRGGGR